MWLAGAATASAATCNWVEDHGPDTWGDAGNWDCGGVPGGDDDAGIRAARRVRGGGAIVNFSSTVVKLALPTYAAYAATNGAVDAMPPLERLGRPEEIAETVAFLAGPARWVNGQIVYTNGGVA